MNQYGRDRDNNNRPPQKFDIPPNAKGKDCRACGKMIYFAPSPKTGKMMPVNPDGTAHWSVCTDGDRFRRDRR